MLLSYSNYYENLLDTENMKVKRILGNILFITLMIFTNIVKGQITVDDRSFTAQQLIEDILIDSPCAVVENIVSSTGTAAGFNGIGYFEENGSGFEIDRGIVLSTGNARSAIGPNNPDTTGEGDGTGWRGDADLTRITSTPNLFNASFIQFEFVPAIDFISFDFLFASDEYVGTFPCTFSDVFAFILTDSSGNSRNLAVLPGTTIPIRVTTVHDGVDLNMDGDYIDTFVDSVECPPTNEEFFNTRNLIGSNSPINFNGYTKVLKASGNVIPNERYTIKLVIADNIDGNFDSAVFLSAGSFNIGGDLGEDRTIANGNPGCIGDSIILNANVGSGSTYVWMRNGIPLVPEDGTTILDGGAKLEVTQNGTYTVGIDISGKCRASDSVIVEFVASPEIINAPVDINSCNPEGNTTTVFDLTRNSSVVLGTQDPSLVNISYHLNENDAKNYTGLSTDNVINNPGAYTNTSANQTIWIRIAELNQKCYEIASFKISVFPVEPFQIENEYLRCLERDGTLINLKPTNTIDLNLDPTIYDFQWYTGIQPVTGNEIIGETSSSFLPLTAGDYTVLVTNKTIGCTLPKTIKVIDSYPPESVTAELISGAFSNNGTIEVTVTGLGTYEYRIDNGNWQEEAVFTKVSKGEHTITVRDKGECNELSTTISLTSDYPEYFTPNGDGFHDLWQIKDTKNITISEVLIFDRYGKLLVNLGPKGNWDGTFNGKPLPSNDYWFKVLYRENEEFKEFKANFTLLR